METDRPSRWPGPAKAAISFTMDNLGEAQDVNKGVWPESQPLGTHPAVRDQLPRMLDLLDRHGVKATYFAEAWSLAVYPDAVHDLSHRGHEVAWHGYQHEPWAQLSAADETLNFTRSFDAAAQAGVRYAGFRPPGGSVNARTYALLRQRGVRYVSPLGELGVCQGVVVLPFEWRGVDALYYMDKFAGIRSAHGEPVALLAPADFRDFLFARIRETVESGGYWSILFHPFLQTSNEKLAVMEQVLDRIGHDPEIWCAPCDQVAQWVTDHPDMFDSSDAP